jgi:hypothetical protein
MTEPLELERLLLLLEANVDTRMYVHAEVCSFCAGTELTLVYHIYYFVEAKTIP